MLTHQVMRMFMWMLNKCMDVHIWMFIKNLDTHSHSHVRNDAIAVDILVESWKELPDDDNPVRYYKRVGDTNKDTNEAEKSKFKKSDFLLVIQTPQQAAMLHDNPRILCVDATHGITGYGYKLLTMMSVDKHGHGLPVGWAITSRENGVTWKLFGLALRHECGPIEPEVVMSDDDNSAWNGLTQVWRTLKHKLLCHWHIKQNVRKHCFGSKSKVQVRKLMVMYWMFMMDVHDGCSCLTVLTDAHIGCSHCSILDVHTGCLIWMFISNLDVHVSQ